MERKNVFVVGGDPFNFEKLAATRTAAECDFHALLDVSEIKRDQAHLDPLLEAAERQLQAFDGRVDAILGYWGFPVTSMVPLLANERGLPSPSLESTIKLEHKYWCRLQQREALDECPRFCAIDPFDPKAASKVTLPFPFWLKPIKAHSSYLGFMIRSRRQLKRALRKVRKGIGRFAAPFNRFLSRLELPPEVAGIDGNWCLAEELISAPHQVTQEGYVHDGDVVVYGTVDSVRYPDNPSVFARYQYPTRLPESVQERMTEQAAGLIRHTGYDQATFNAEFFYDEATDRVSLLEINPRLSQSHGELFQRVDGAPHHQVAVELALGRRPTMPRREGAYGVAAKCFLKAFEDGVIQRVPSPEELEELARQVPGSRVRVLVAPGTRLSELRDQDSYSYNLAEFYVGARDAEELEERYAACVAAFGHYFRLEPVFRRAEPLV